MTRNEAVSKIKSVIESFYCKKDSGFECLAELILKEVEKIGMKPPPLDEDKCQAIMRVYYGGYSFNQWDDVFEKDADAKAALEKIIKQKEDRNRILKKRQETLGEK